MSLINIIILSVIQGLAELLPVSSSAHVIAAAKILHLDPTTPQFVLLLVMLHTGTMFAVIVYFWKAWMRTFFHSQAEFIRFSTKIVITTGITGVLGLGIQKLIERQQDPGYTQFVSWSISNAADFDSPPNAQTRLADLVATDAKSKKLFKAGETLTLSAKRDGEPLPYEQFTVKPDSKLNDLMLSFKHGFSIDSKAAPSHAGIPKPGIRLMPDPDHRDAIQIVVTGNEGKENKLKFDGFTDMADQSRLGLADVTKSEVEKLFKNLELMAGALAAAGILILFTGVAIYFQKSTRKGITTADSVWLGVIQAICLPFRGFSRSGATISLALLRGITRQRAEEFSFAMAVVLTPPLIMYEAYRLYEHMKQTTPLPISVNDFLPGLKGMVFSFLAGLVALKLLSKLLEKGQWWLFGVYCLVAAGGVFWLHTHGYGN